MLAPDASTPLDASRPTTSAAAVDGSGPSLVAARSAVGVLGADRRYLLVRVVDVVPSMSPTGQLVSGALDPLRDEVRRQARDELDELAGDLPAASVETHVAHGDPVTVLLQAADAVDADVVVVGSRGLGAVRRAVLGSVSGRLVREASRPVLVVPS